MKTEYTKRLSWAKVISLAEKGKARLAAASTANAPAASPAASLAAILNDESAPPEQASDLTSIAPRIRQYLSRVAIAVSGSNGHDRTFYMAGRLVRGFDLTPEQALPFAMEWNSRCQPPWSESEILRKLREADRQPGPRGFLSRKLGFPSAPGESSTPGDVPSRPIQLANFYWEEKQDGETLKAVKVPRPCEDIFDDLTNATGGWPKLCGKSLFAVNPNNPNGVEDLSTAEALFAWADSRLGSPGRSGLNWSGGRDGPSMRIFFEYCRASAERYAAFSSYPHEPPIPGYFYTGHLGGDGASGEESPPSETRGAALAGLLRFFCPATKEDEDLIRCLAYTLFWGGPSGKRPAFVPTAPAESGDGRGYGKTTLANTLAKLAGGLIEMGQEEEIEEFKTRLLTPDAINYRMLLIDNVKTTKFSRAGLESLITSETISGRQLFVGNGQRPNTFTTVITMNGASLSSDLAQRCIPIHLRKPDYGQEWDEAVGDYIQRYRREITEDILFDLRKTPAKVSTPFRWGLWQRQVLSRATEDPDGLTRLILARQGEANTDSEESDLVQELLMDEIEAVTIGEPQSGAVFITAAAMARIASKALGVNKPVNHWSRIIGMMGIRGLKAYRMATTRGWIWKGEEWVDRVDEDGNKVRWNSTIQD